MAGRSSIVQALMGHLRGDGLDMAAERSEAIGRFACVEGTEGDQVEPWEQVLHRRGD